MCTSYCGKLKNLQLYMLWILPVYSITCFCIGGWWRWFKYAICTSNYWMQNYDIQQATQRGGFAKWSLSFCIKIFVYGDLFLALHSGCSVHFGSRKPHIVCICEPKEFWEIPSPLPLLLIWNRLNQLLLKHLKSKIAISFWLLTLFLLFSCPLWSTSALLIYLKRFQHPLCANCKFPCPPWTWEHMNNLTKQQVLVYWMNMFFLLSSWFYVYCNSMETC